MLTIKKNNALNYEYYFTNISPVALEREASKKLKDIHKLKGKIQKNETKFDPIKKEYQKIIFAQF